MNEYGPWGPGSGDHPGVVVQDLENEVNGAPILVCRDPLETPTELRDDLRHYE